MHYLMGRIYQQPTRTKKEKSVPFLLTNSDLFLLLKQHLHFFADFADTANNVPKPFATNHYVTSFETVKWWSNETSSDEMVAYYMNC